MLCPDNGGDSFPWILCSRRSHITAFLNSMTHYIGLENLTAIMQDVTSRNSVAHLGYFQSLSSNVSEADELQRIRKRTHVVKSW
jgi:hypothetical protein